MIPLAKSYSAFASWDHRLITLTTLPDTLHWVFCRYLLSCSARRTQPIFDLWLFSKNISDNHGWQIAGATAGPTCQALENIIVLTTFRILNSPLRGLPIPHYSKITQFRLKFHINHKNAARSWSNYCLNNNLRCVNEIINFSECLFALSPFSWAIMFASDFMICLYRCVL